MKKITCIIVDDEEKVANRMKTLVSEYTDLTVILVETDAEKVVNKISLLKPDIVFLDVEMPGKTGFEIIEEVRSENISPSFVLVTAYGHYAIHAIKESAFDYLLKPVDIDELKACVEKYKKKKNQKIEFVEDIEKNVAIDTLSEREKEIVRLIVKGKTSRKIAEELFISKHTVDKHRRNILRKTGLKTAGELIAFALKNRLDAKT